MNPLERPRLRPVASRAVDIEGQRAILISDPEGLSDKVFPVTLYGAFLLDLMDGAHTVEQMREAFHRATGHDAPEQTVRDLIADMDKAGFLESPAFLARREKIVRDFMEAPLREARHAGSYTPDAKKLPKFLAAFYKGEGGTGKPAPKSVKKGPVKAILAPHIDFHRGGGCYAHAYAALAAGCDADTFVVLGTAHKCPPNLFTATKKPYDTPLGPVPTDTEFLDELARRWPAGNLFADEFFHRDEHSIEFQAVCLRWLFKKRPIKIVPILVSSLHEHVLRKSDPMTDPRLRGFVEALQATMKGRKVCLVGGVDLSHVGAKFGDPDPLTLGMLGRIEEEDRASLDRAAAIDASGFFKSIADVADWRKICGLSAITTLLAATDASKGRLVKYDRFADMKDNELVSFAAMEFR